MKNTSTIKSFTALGTVNTIQTLDGVSSIAAKAAVRRVKEINDKMSYYSRESEIYELNSMAGKGEVSLSYDTMKVLKRAKEFIDITNGAFNIASQPLTNLWEKAARRERPPHDSEIEKAMANIGTVELDDINLTASLPKKGQAVGLGGIAKGYAADEAVKTLKQFGTKNALVALGGNIWAIGDKNGQGWRVGIQNPAEQRGVTLGDVMVFDETVVSSGVYEKFFMNSGTRYHHIIDPRTGRPAQTGLLSVTLIGNCSMDMDAVATAALILGINDGVELVKKMNAQAIFVDSMLNVFATSGLKGRLTLNSDRKTNISGGA